MTAEDFNLILVGRLQRVEQTLGAKATEYASEADRLHNFKKASELTGQSPAQACLGMAVKHWVSICDIVDGNAVDGGFRLHLLDEKLTDAICYLVLLEAILLEKKS